MLHISIESIDFPEYWIHILVYTKTTFRTLDNFLRDIWCECCGHLSGFWIDKPFGTARIGKRSKIGEILMPKMKFFYVYDFGTSTILLLKVHDMYQVSTKNRIILLARNYPQKSNANAETRPNTFAQYVISKIQKTHSYAKNARKNINAKKHSYQLLIHQEWDYAATKDQDL